MLRKTRFLIKGVWDKGRIWPLSGGGSKAFPTKTRDHLRGKQKASIHWEWRSMKSPLMEIWTKTNACQNHRTSKNNNNNNTPLQAKLQQPAEYLHWFCPLSDKGRRQRKTRGEFSDPTRMKLTNAPNRCLSEVLDPNLTRDELILTRDHQRWRWR